MFMVYRVRKKDLSVQQGHDETRRTFTVQSSSLSPGTTDHRPDIVDLPSSPSQPDNCYDTAGKGRAESVDIAGTPGEMMSWGGNSENDFVIRGNDEMDAEGQGNTPGNDNEVNEQEGSPRTSKMAQ